MGVWRHFHEGFNFWILTLFGSGYAGLGLGDVMKDFVGEGVIGEDDRRLDALFQEFRAVCPDPGPGANFMPGVWRKIDDGRNSLWAAFARFGRIAAPACAAACLLLLVLNLVSLSDTRLSWTYTDALAADATAEKMYYAEAVRTGSDADYALPTANDSR
jgi:hypothetical protein